MKQNNLKTSNGQDLLTIPLQPLKNQSQNSAPSSLSIDVQKKKLKDVQEISCLYSEHLYKSLKKDDIYEAQLQKYKQMYEREKKVKVKLLGQQRQWYEEKEKMTAEREVILFALDTLTVKMVEQQQQESARHLSRRTSRNPDSFKKGNLAITNRPQQQKKENGIKLQKRSSKLSARNSTSKHGYETKNNQKLAKQRFEEADESDSTHKHKKGILSVLQKLKLIKQIKQNLNIKSINPTIEGLLEKSTETPKFQVTEHPEYQKLLTDFQNNEVKVMDMEKQLASLKRDVKIKNSLIQKSNEKIAELELTVITTNQLNEQMKQKIGTTTRLHEEVSGRNKILQVKIRDLEEQMRITQDQYARKEEKQRQCVKILQKFASELKLSDEKIQEFLSKEMGSDYEEPGEELKRSKKTYQEHISYILHLCKKKQTLYENLLEQFKERVKESDFRVIILQKKLKSYHEAHIELHKAVAEKVSWEDLHEILRKLKK